MTWASLLCSAGQVRADELMACLNFESGTTKMTDESSSTLMTLLAAINKGPEDMAQISVLVNYSDSSGDDKDSSLPILALATDRALALVNAMLNREQWPHSPLLWNGININFDNGQWPHLRGCNIEIHAMYYYGSLVEECSKEWQANAQCGVIKCSSASCAFPGDHPSFVASPHPSTSP